MVCELWSNGKRNGFLYIYLNMDGRQKENKEEKTMKIEEIVYIFHNNSLFLPYSSHLTS